jgi:hypothetical protein
MAACAKAVQQPDGRFVLEVDPAATELTACQYVVQSGPELSNSLMLMTAEDGAIASGLIVSCWITAYYIRSVISMFRGSSKDDS